MQGIHQDVPVLEHCRQLGQQAGIGLSDLRRVMATLDFSDATIAALQRLDASHPYGRRVLIETASLEGMLATWTRGVPCLPHTHGGSVGTVGVLRGRAKHCVWRVEAGALRLVMEERVEPGAILSCGPEMIHSMADDGADEPLVTFHLYTDPIDHMIVYDLEQNRTLTVDGGCGAWIPEDSPELIHSSRAGIHSAAELAATQNRTVLA